ncbi:MAG: hypothetical protein ACI35S_02450 [Anaeroplasma sp.]
MIKAYQKILEMESVTLLKLEQDKKALERIKKILHQDKEFILNKLVIYLTRELDINYYRYQIVDIEDNIADIIVKKDSKIFKNNIEGKDYLNFTVEDLIDKRMFNNEDEIIIVGLNLDNDLINLAYLCDCLDYNFLSYSDKLKQKISEFVDYVITKDIYKR